MQSKTFMRILFLIILTFAAGISHADVAIVISENARETEPLAANELQRLDLRGRGYMR